MLLAFRGHDPFSFLDRSRRLLRARIRKSSLPEVPSRFSQMDSSCQKRGEREYPGRNPHRPHAGRCSMPDVGCSNVTTSFYCHQCFIIRSIILQSNKEAARRNKVGSEALMPNIDCPCLQVTTCSALASFRGERTGTHPL